MRVPTLAALVAVATLSASVSVPAEAGGNGIWSQIQALQDQGYKKIFSTHHFKLLKKKTQNNSTPYTIEYRSRNNPMDDNPCWTEQKLAFHQYVAGTCVYDPDMYNSLIVETQGSSSSCTKSTVIFKKQYNNSNQTGFQAFGNSYGSQWNQSTYSSTTEGNCPTHGGQEEND
jgi:hypothetical protein